MLEENLFKPPEAEVKDYVEKREGYTLARRGTRLAAVILDGIIAMALYLPLVFLFGLSLDQPGPVNYLLGAAAFWGVNLYLIFKHQQTIGKKLMGIKIVRKDFSKCSGGRILGIRMFLMGIFTSIPFVGSVVGLVDPLMIFRKSQYCLHDDLADTCVVEVAK